MEASDESGDQFGYDRMADLILYAARQGMSPQAIIDRLFEAVRAFCGDASPEDDMTCVVIAANK